MIQLFRLQAFWSHLTTTVRNIWLPAEPCCAWDLGVPLLAHFCSHLLKTHPPFSPDFLSSGQPPRPGNSPGWKSGALCPRCPLVLPRVTAGPGPGCAMGSAAREGTQVLQCVPYLMLNECFDMQLFQTMDHFGTVFLYSLFSFPLLIGRG